MCPTTPDSPCDCVLRPRWCSVHPGPDARRAPRRGLRRRAARARSRGDGLIDRVRRAWTSGRARRPEGAAAGASPQRTTTRPSGAAARCCRLPRARPSGGFAADVDVGAEGLHGGPVQVRVAQLDAGPLQQADEEAGGQDVGHRPEPRGLRAAPARSWIPGRWSWSSGPGRVATRPPRGQPSFGVRPVRVRMPSSLTGSPQGRRSPV